MKNKTNIAIDNDLHASIKSHYASRKQGISSGAESDLGFCEDIRNLAKDVPPEKMKIISRIK